jgi:hypothetical protein
MCGKPRSSAARELRRHVGVALRQLIQRLSDNLELPFDGRAQQHVILVFRKCLTGGELAQEASSAQRVPRILSRIRLRRSVLASA